jgi:ribosome maturation factor RimP
MSYILHIDSSPGIERSLLSLLMFRFYSHLMKLEMTLL